MRRWIGWVAVALVFCCAASQGGEPARRYGYLGVGLGRVSEALAAQLGLERGEGILVEQVEKGSPAEKAGFAKNDVIVKIDDQVVLSDEQLRKLIGYSKPGMALNVEVVRKAKRQMLTVELGGTEHAPVIGASPIRFPTGPGMSTTHDIITLRGPDGKTITLALDGAKGPKEIGKQLEKLQADGVIPPGLLEHLMRLRRGGALPDVLLGPDQQKAAEKAEKRMNDGLGKPVSFDFVATPITDALAFLRGLCGVNYLTDPALSAKNPQITLKANDMAHGNALDWICKLAGAQRAVGHGVVCVGYPEFVARFKKTKPLETDDRNIRPVLDRALSFDFVATPLTDVAAFLNGLLKVNIVVLNEKKDETVSVRMDKVSAGTALPFIGLLVGREVTVEKQAVTFGKPEQAGGVH